MGLKGFFSEHIKTIHFSWRRVWISVVAVVVFVSIFLVGALVYARTYTDRVLPGVYLGDIHIGGMETTELTDYLQNMQTKLVDEGIHFTFKVNGHQKDFIVNPQFMSEDTLIELIDFDVTKEVENILTYRKNNNIFADTFSALWVRVSKPHVHLSYIEFDKEGVFEEIEIELEDYISEPRDASVDVVTVEPLVFDVTSSSIGVSFDYDRVAGQIIQSWSSLVTPEITIASFEAKPEVVKSDIEPIIDRLPNVFENGRLDINYIDPHTKQEYTWYVSLEEMSDWIEVQRKEGNGFVFGLKMASTTEFLEGDIADFVNIEPHDAKFQIGTNGKVVEFQGSRPGVGVDVEGTYKAINDAVIERTLHDEGVTKAVTLLNEQVEPNIKTGEVNDLGIEEILGIGHSKFLHSTPNRLKNISHAANNKLNGLLIKPGEEFSLINTLKPFTYEGGYSADYTIKGDKMVKEIGGGLCQIGTTMFRTAMNAGLKITERREHSLAVPYYNDLVSGNPGVDATIYDPHPDLRFVNDTGNYILITSDLNLATEDLRFYFWGTSDGRKARYTSPVVSRWIPAGEPRMVETTDLAPGVKECQYAYTGAQASFTYIIERPNGEVDERVFSSYYRPLPKICLVGVEEKTEECPEGEECEEVEPEENQCTEPGGCGVATDEDDEDLEEDEN
ncbi:VanW family protein [Candidatus Parcubacteria bacterium]|jgi:vancomycin resistance protein YoaR|nr:VanW family protein [Candidatus Parcubacteria bacterium]MBT3949383.1 VanW family protein [Candidatus Parcubacteria bacterium]